MEFNNSFSSKMEFEKSHLTKVENLSQNKDEDAYLYLLQKILEEDKIGRETRNAPTYSIFGPQLEFSLLSENDIILPLLTTKRMFLRGIFEELIFFIKGDTNTKHLEERDINIWKGNTSREFLNSRELFDYPEGDMGPMYGFNWRHFGASYFNCTFNYEDKGYDQLAELLKNLINEPNSRRHLLTTYDPSKVSQSVLAPCHGIAIQFYVSDGFLDCKMLQRSSDAVLGLPFNIASYAMLTIFIAYVVNLTPRKLIITFGDTHIYKDHEEAAKIQICRTPYPFPKFKLKKEFTGTTTQQRLKFLEELQFSDIEVIDYKYHPGIKAKMFA